MADEMEKVVDETVIDPAKERVEKELEELNEKLVKLTKFLYSTKPIECGLSHRMVNQMSEQVRCMQEYARVLIVRLLMWGKTDEELCTEERKYCR